MTAATNRDAALAYARKGWLPFPLVGKKPITEHAYLDATADENQIRAWWTEYPDAAVAIAMRPSGLIAIDVDPRNGGAETFAKLEAEHGPLPRACDQATGGGGTHIVMADPSPGPEGWTRPQAQGGACRGKLGQGVDVKCNGYIVVQPSPGYRWRALDIRNPPAVPDAWCAALRKAAATLDTVDVADWSTTVRPLTEAQEDALRRALKALGPRASGKGTTYAAVLLVFHKYGLSLDDGAPFLLEWNEGNGKPYDGHELARQVDRISATAPANGRGMATLDLFDRAPGQAPPAAVEIDRPELADVIGYYRACHAKIRTSRKPDDRTDADAIATVLSSKPPPDHVTLTVAARALVRRKHDGFTTADMLGLLARHWNPTEASAELDDVDAAPAFDAGAQRSPDGFVLATTGPGAGRVPVASQENVRRALELLDVDLRHDLLADRARLDGESIADHLVNALYFKIETDYGFKYEHGAFCKLIEVVAREHAFHPVRDYLDGLEWDGVSRLDRWLIDYAGAADTPYVRAVSRLALVAAVRRVRQPGCKFDELLILESPEQGTNKSSAIRMLAVKPEWFTDDLPLQANTQRRVEATSGKWMVEVAELNGMRQADHDELKRYLSAPVDRCRRAYDHFEQDIPRQWIAIGSTNRSEYLGDATGNRRYWPVRIVRFDLDALGRDRDQLWAEAAAAEGRGESIRLSEALWEVAAEEQNARRIADPIEDKLRPLLDGKVGKIRAGDLPDLVGIKEPTRNDKLRIGEAMRTLGWVQPKDGRRFGGPKPEPAWIPKSTGKGDDLEHLTLSKLRPVPVGLAALHAEVRS